MRKQLEDSMSTAATADAWAQLSLLASAVDSELDRWLGDAFRVSATELRALELLSRASDKELRVNELAQRIGLNASSVTRLVNRLEAKGLARRDLCADDGRGVYAVIDEAGERLLADARPAADAHLASVLSQLAARFPQLDAGATKRALSEVGDRIG
ncbi:MarR family winged helix-turn-helix transcriptional regulator [Agromyces sp. NPDC060279]|uniref:MarR family winged helix-turn-helix transcriptional regulator n=1 Tax=Agromyces sp. NPDC060279 TaxID=3347092 RepID=UPI003666128C